MDTEASLVGVVRKHVVGVGVVGVSCSGDGRAGEEVLGPCQLSPGDWVAVIGSGKSRPLRAASIQGNSTATSD